ncbi:transcription termination/antitermination protein NusG [Arenimonas sp.]|uniref:transcription termination/antitermination protein NusG n=1 Tax=Arenimonas sp. TaxID=1872635 RepID=UPI0039E54FBB
MESWFAVLTKSRSEAIAQEHLRRQGYDCLFPRLSRVFRTARGIERRIESLFPRYVFLRADPGERSLAPVRSTRGVAGLVRFAGEPARVPDSVIDRIRQRMAETDGFVHLSAPDYAPGQAVRVTEGPLMGWEGVFMAAEGADRVRLLLELLGSAREVVLPRQQLAVCV